MKKSRDSSKDSQKVQGEGDYKAAERYGKSVRTFVQSGKVDDAAQKAKPVTPGDVKNSSGPNALVFRIRKEKIRFRPVHRRENHEVNAACFE